tara:strand:- start:4636 stop:4908 length:273 start_codon:yes stop_codon:yes gene_type:complete
MVKKHVTVGELIEILTQPRDTTMDTNVVFYFLQGYDLESMEIESVLHFDETPTVKNVSQTGGNRVEITLKRIGTDEGGNSADDDVGVSIL